ncbi:hypothetical protein MKW92_051923, partial [Papaver armeniacum]
MALQLRVSSLTKTTPSLLSSHNHNQSSNSKAFLLLASPGVRKFASPSKSSTRSRQQQDVCLGKEWYQQLMVSWKEFFKY